MARVFTGSALAACVLAFLLTLPLAAQQNSAKQMKHGLARDSAQNQQSDAYHQGYGEGLRDRDRNLEPSPGYANWSKAADRRAYRDGYHAGYCKDEDSRTGYYNGVYRNYGPPVIRNGYYGYNAPTQFCKDNGAVSPPKHAQSGVEYGGGG